MRGLVLALAFVACDSSDSSPVCPEDGYEACCADRESDVVVSDACWAAAERWLDCDALLIGDPEPCRVADALAVHGSECYGPDDPTTGAPISCADVVSSSCDELHDCLIE